MGQRSTLGIAARREDETRLSPSAGKVERVTVSSQSSNPRHERVALHNGFSSHALELLPKSHVCVKPRQVFVEMQEGPRPTVEDSRLLLDQSGHRAEPFEERLDSLDRLGGGVPHLTSVYFGSVQSALRMIVSPDLGRAGGRRHRVRPRDIRGMTTRRCQPAIPPQPCRPACLKRAADQDRTGIISLEG